MKPGLDVIAKRLHAREPRHGVFQECIIFVHHRVDFVNIFVMAGLADQVVAFHVAIVVRAEKAVDLVDIISGVGLESALVPR